MHSLRLCNDLGMILARVPMLLRRKFVRRKHAHWVRALAILIWTSIGGINLMEALKVCLSAATADVVVPRRLSDEVASCSTTLLYGDQGTVQACANDATPNLVLIMLGSNRSILAHASTRHTVQVDGGRASLRIV